MDCECLSECPFFNNRMENNSALGAIYKKNTALAAKPSVHGTWSKKRREKNVSPTICIPICSMKPGGSSRRLSIASDSCPGSS